MANCTLPHKDSRSNCKQFLVDIDAIDDFMNLKDETLFMAANKQMREQAEKVYQITGQKNPFLIEDFAGARKVVANLEFHRMVDSVRKRLGLYGDKIAGKVPKPVEDPIKKELKNQILYGKEIPTGFNIQELGGHSKLLWEQGSNTELGFDNRDYPAILSSLQSRIGSRSFQQVWNSREFTDNERNAILLHFIQQKLLTGDTFNSRLFRKLNGQLGLPIHIVQKSAYSIYVQNKELFIDLSKFRTLIDNSNLQDVSKYIETVLSEELIHIVSQRLMTSEDYENISRELTEGGKKSIQKLYSMGNIPDELAIAEYMSMLVQQRFLGTTTEQTKFTNFENLFSRIWEYLVDVFKGNKGELKRQYDRHFDYIDDYEFYNKSDVYDTSPELIDRLKEFATKLNPDFRIEVLDELTSAQGSSVDAVAKINQFLIQLRRGKESSLPEEICHFFVELLDSKSDLFKRMNDEITRTRIYKETVATYKKEYGNDTQRLKKEATAKLIALYLTDKKAFKYQSGSPSLIENITRWIKEFLGFVNKEVSPFASAAQDILDLDISQLTENAFNKDDMYALSDANFQTVRENFSGYDKVVININDTLFDYKGFPGSATDKRNLIFGPNKDEYYTKVGLTVLGKELRDKINAGWVDPTKLILITKMVVTPALLARIQAEFGKVEIKNFEGVTTATTEDGQTIQIPGESEEDFINGLKSLYKNVLYVDNNPVKTEGIKSRKYDNRYAKYENPELTRERERRENDNKKVTQKLRQEIERLLNTDGKQSLLDKVIYATNIIRKQFSKMEWMENRMKEMSPDEVQDLFKDNQGFIGLPVAAAQRVFKMVKEGNRLTDAVVDFVATLETTTAFFAEKNKSRYKDLYNAIESGDPLQVERAIQELNMLVKMADSWKEWTGQFNNFITDYDGTDLMKGTISRMNAEIERVKILTLPLSQLAIQKTLSPIFNVYNENKNAQIEDKRKVKQSYLDKGDQKSADKIQETIERLEKGLMDPETIVKALRGEINDIPSITVWVKNLYNSEDVLVSGVASLIKEREMKANTESIIRSQQAGERFNNLRVQYNLTDEDVRSLLTLEKVKVWNNEKEEYEEKEALALMNLWQNREDFFKQREPMIEAYEKWKEDKTDENLRDYYEKKRVFESWKSINWHDEFTEEFYKRYEDLKQTPEDAYIYEKATSTQNELWAKVRELSESLEYQTDENETDRINQVIKDTVREAKNLRSDIDLLGNKKTGENLEMALMLQKKLEIDKDVYEYKSDTKRFTTDLKSLVTSFDPLILPNDIRENILHLIDTSKGNYAKLSEYIRNEPSVPDEIVKWLERNTVNRFAQEFYDSRKEITDKLSQAFKELTNLYGEDSSSIDEIWQKIFNESSYTRDEDGILDGSNATSTTQDLVRRFEEEMERIKSLATANRAVTTLTPDERKRVKELKMLIADKVEELTQIQSKDTTDYYMETFVDYAEETGFTTLLEQANIPIAYGINVQALINSVPFKTLMVNNPDHPFIQWIDRNHYYKAKMVDTGNQFEEVRILTPTYLWFKVTPTDKSFIEQVPSFKYSQRQVRDKSLSGVPLKTEKVDWKTWNPIKKQWLPKSQAYMNPQYLKLQARTDNKGKGLQLLLKEYTDFHLATQTDTLREARLEFILPYIQKKDLEGNFLTSMYNQFTNKNNRFESGEGNYEENAPTEDKTTLKDRLKNWYNGFVTQVPQAGKQANKIAVPYSTHVSPDEMSTDISLMLVMFAGTTSKAESHRDLLALTSLVKENLADQSTKRNESGKIRTNANRLEAIQFLEDTNFFGKNKLYEVGKTVDRVTTGIRKINTFGSLSDITGFFNNIKNNLQGRLQNFINAEFAGWSSTSSMAKAATIAGKSLPKYLYETEQPLSKRSKDYHIVTFFLPTLSNNFNQMLLKGATSNVAKTSAGFYMSMMSEFGIATTTLYGHLLHVKVEKDGITKTLYDILKPSEGTLGIEEGWTIKGRNTQVDMDYMYRTLTTFISVQEYVQGKMHDKTKLSQTTIGNSLLYFKNWLIPMLRRRFDKNRANYQLGEDVEGYWITFGRLTTRILRDFIKDGQLYWHTYTDEEKHNYITTLKEIGVMFSSLILISLVFGFDADDPDKFKKLKDNSYLENTLLLIALQTKNETESLSAMPFVNIEKGFIPPIITEGAKFKDRPFVGLSTIDQTAKLLNATFDLVRGSSTAYYEAKNDAYNIAKGDSKASHYFLKVSQLDDFIYLSNPDGKIQAFISMLKR